MCVMCVLCVCRLEEGGVLTDCQLTTQDAEETLDFDFVSANVVAKLIMAAECLREAFSELDMTSEVVEVMMTPDPPHFRLTTFGYAGTTQVHTPTHTHTHTHTHTITVYLPHPPHTLIRLTIPRILKWLKCLNVRNLQSTGRLSKIVCGNFLIVFCCLRVGTSCHCFGPALRHSVTPPRSR